MIWGQKIHLRWVYVIILIFLGICKFSFFIHHARLKINYSVIRNWILFNLSKNSPERISIINSWNSEIILSFIISKSSGKHGNGSGQYLSNSNSLTFGEVDQRLIPWTIITTSTCSRILKLLVHNFICVPFA